jgi:hypothetical protein
MAIEISIVTSINGKINVTPLVGEQKKRNENELLVSRAMAMPTVAAAAAALHSAVWTRRVGVGNGDASAAPGGYLAGCWRGAVRARVADAAAPVAAERGRQEAPAAHVVEIPVTCYQVNCLRIACPPVWLR